MAQVPIGKFIAEMRKSINLTQRRLADALFVSDKTASKENTEKRFNVFLLSPLCGILRTNVNTPLSRGKASSADGQKSGGEYDRPGERKGGGQEKNGAVQYYRRNHCHCSMGPNLQ